MKWQHQSLPCTYAHITPCSRLAGAIGELSPSSARRGPASTEPGHRVAWQTRVVWLFLPLATDRGALLFSLADLTSQTTCAPRTNTHTHTHTQRKQTCACLVFLLKLDINIDRQKIYIYIYIYIYIILYI